MGISLLKANSSRKDTDVIVNNENNEFTVLLLSCQVGVAFDQNVSVMYNSGFEKCRKRKLWDIEHIWTVPGEVN